MSKNVIEVQSSHRKTWTAKDDRLLHSMRRNGDTWDVIAETLGRTVKATQMRYWVHSKKSDNVVKTKLSEKNNLPKKVQKEVSFKVDGHAFKVPTGTAVSIGSITVTF